MESVLAQTYHDWECIIVNDGSTDNTLETVEKWSLKDNRFTFFSKENGGVVSARNFGIEKANGLWILPLDGDDKIGSQYLEKAAAEFENGCDIIYCDAEFFGETTGVWKLGNFELSDLLLRNQIFCSAFFRKKDWEKIGGYDDCFNDGFEDWEFWINLFSKIEKRKILKLNYTGFFYRRKVQSRDIEVNQNLEKKNKVENLIFKKHAVLYESIFGTQMQILRRNQQLNNENDMLRKKSEEIYNQRNKNLFTKLLSKLIFYFSK